MILKLHNFVFQLLNVSNVLYIDDDDDENLEEVDDSSEDPQTDDDDEDLRLSKFIRLDIETAATPSTSTLSNLSSISAISNHDQRQDWKLISKRDTKSWLWNHFKVYESSKSFNRAICVYCHEKHVRHPNMKPSSWELKYGGTCVSTSKLEQHLIHKHNDIYSK